MKRRSLLLGFLPLALAVLSPSPALAKYIGAEPPACHCQCETGRPCTDVPVEGAISLVEGNLKDQYAVSSITSTNGPTVSLSLAYNSYNADGSRAQVDTVVGYGWTHSYNIFLFSQLGSMFRFDGEGRVTRYGINPGGSFSPATGYFETLVKNPDGSFTLTQKDKTTFRFAAIPNTPFLVGGPVWRLTNIMDRNGNTTTLSYSGGNLTRITDTYGRNLSLTYSSQNKLISVTDPAGRVTNLHYDSTGRKLIKITDPDGKSIQYSYNFLYQLTGKVDKDGRTFSYTYANNQPVAATDGAGSARATLSNPNNWATDPVRLAMFQNRVYRPSTTSNTDGRGNVWRYQYDANGYLTHTIAPDGATTSYTYDPATLLVASQTDANGHTTAYRYDAQGNRIRMTDALGHVTTYTYEPVFNMLTSITDPKGRVTKFDYDARGNRIQETDPLGQIHKWTYNANGNLLTETDKNGHTTTYQYDSSGNRTKMIDALGNVTVMTHDPVGNLSSRTDANGHTTRFEYDGLNRAIKVTDPAGKITQTFYDGESNRTKIIDRNGHATSYDYDLRRRLIQMTDALDHKETYSYDGNDNRVSMTDRNGHTTSYQHDAQNRLIKIIDALGNVTITAYDFAGNVLTETDANNHATTFRYDELNRRVTTTDALANVTQFEYDTGGTSGCSSCGATPGSSLVTKQTDPNGKVTYFKYDALDRLILVVRKVGGAADVISPADAVTSYTYDPVSNRLSVKEPNGNTTTYEYDGDNRRIKETNAAGDVTATAYDGVNNVISTTAPNGNVTANAYDSLDRVIQISDSIGLVIRYTYDAEGNRVSQTDPNGHTITYAYDALNRLVATTDPLSQATKTEYDPVGNVLKVTDRNGNATVYAYDAINRRTSTTDALGHTTQFQYDPVGNLVKLTDANLHATQYAYDAINRPIRETYADGKARSFTYDGAGNLLTRTDQIGQSTTYTYNDLYFLVGRSYPSGLNDSFTYDLSGRMLTAQRGAWPISFAYDGGNRVIHTVQNGRAIDYRYDIPGRTRTVTYPGGRVIVERMDARSRLSEIDGSSSPPIVRYSYDPANRVGSRSYRNGTVAAYSYNANDWIVALEHSHGSTRIAGFGYDYDHEGNKKFEQKPHDTSHSEAYQYDNIYRLIDYKVGALVGSTVPVPSTQTAYNLDPVGNWNSKTTDGVTQTRAHNAVNELTKIDATNLSYDANGNVQADGSYRYGYDEENRLTGVTRISDSAVVGQYQYDALSRRVAKIAHPVGVPVTTFYFYDDARIIEEQNSAGATQATYVYGNYIDEVLTMDRAAQTFYYHQNALWSVEAVTNGAGSVAERYSYDAYGLPSITDGAGVPVPANAWGTPHSAIGNPWMFTGRQVDEETGIYYYRARYYDTFKARFLQRDPLGYVEGLNLYEYGVSNPVFWTDPSGLGPREKLLEDIEKTRRLLRELEDLERMSPGTCRNRIRDVRKKLEELEEILRRGDQIMQELQQRTGTLGAAQDARRRANENAPNQPAMGRQMVQKDNFNPNERSTVTCTVAGGNVTLTFGRGFENDQKCSVILRPGIDAPQARDRQEVIIRNGTATYTPPAGLAPGRYTIEVNCATSRTKDNPLRGGKAPVRVSASCRVTL